MRGGGRGADGGRDREAGRLAAGLSFDMGGTTAKAAIVRDGRPRLTRSYEVARLARFMPGSGSR